MGVTDVRACGAPWRATLVVLVGGGCGGESVLTVARTRDFTDAQIRLDGAHPDSKDASSVDASAVDAAPMVVCGDTKMDVHNCGRCGHDCQGGDCIDGVCQPVKVADATVCTIALDAENVYWVAGDTTSPVLMALPTKGDSPRVLASASTGVTTLGVDADNLYYGRSVGAGSGLNSHSGAVIQVPLRGGAPTTVASGSYSPSAVAVQGEHVYFTTMWRSTFDPADQTPAGSVIKASITTGLATTLVTGLKEAVDIETDATDVYWVEYFGAGCSWGCIVSMPLGGGTPTTVVSNANTTQLNIHAFALMGSEVFWTNEGISSTVMKQDIRGGTPVTLATDQKEPGAIAVDDTSVYWAPLGGSLMKAPRNGGAPTTLASNPCRPCAIAANDSSVFWVTCDSLMRIAK